MNDFQCHYREERWQTARYFDFVKDFLIAAQNKEDSDYCDPPPCPTTPYAVTTADYLNGECLFDAIFTRVGLLFVLLYRKPSTSWLCIFILIRFALLVVLTNHMPAGFG